MRAPKADRMRGLPATRSASCLPEFAGRKPNPEGRAKNSQTATMPRMAPSATRHERGARNEQEHDGRESAQHQVGVGALEGERHAGERRNGDQDVTMAEEDGLALARCRRKAR